MDIPQLLRALGLQQAYQSYQQNIGEPFAAVVGGGARGMFGLDRPEYGGLLGQEAYRTGQAIGNMPAVSAPVGAFKAAAQAPELAGLLGTIMSPKVGMTMKETIRSSADDLAEQLSKLGFNAQVEHSGSKAGPSSYVSIYDPQTGRRFIDPIRFSGHSKGPFQSQFVYDVQDVSQDIPKIIEAALQMRSAGPTESMKKMAARESLIEEYIASGMKPKQAHTEAYKIIPME